MSNTTDSGIASVVIQSVLIIPSLVLYVIVVLGLIATCKYTKNTFYLLMISLAVADICYLCETLFYSVPCIILQTAIYGSDAERIIGHLDTTTWFLQCSHYLFISINRLRFVCGTSLQTFDKVFTKTKTAWWILGIWIFSIGMTILSEIAECHKVFKVTGFYWTFNCSTETSSNFGMITNNVISGLFCLLSGLLCVVICIIVKYKRNAIAAAQGNSYRPVASRISLEISMCIQFSAITGCAVLNYLGFWIFSRIFPAVAATMLIQIFAIANASINPYIYLAFNKVLRIRIQDLFRIKIIKKPQATIDVKLIAWVWPNQQPQHNRRNGERNVKLERNGERNIKN